ncbi:hypothetical protein HNR23_002277 [Nocardiopsis mwathae]|uniref:Uncharacterized protein n=1 Tax=Nocardiopsis mwathae TaxID=1472723 RepID=A0A7X0D5B7_9ACTN|nr:hypothetical protein [Nocardiopsis mwathae]MBB6172217.1 hypothetical protein [Nocardiopsis mwathae]
MASPTTDVLLEEVRAKHGQHWEITPEPGGLLRAVHRTEPRNPAAEWGQVHTELPAPDLSTLEDKLCVQEALREGLRGNAELSRPER